MAVGVRLEPAIMARAAMLLEQAVAQQQVPGAVAAAGVGAQTVWTTAVGWTELGASARPMTPEAIFDLASLTKVLVTLPAILLLVERGTVLLSDRVADLIEDFAGGDKAQITLEHLLSHTSGLPNHRYLSAYGQSRADMLRGLHAELLERAPGTEVVYSDLGYILLGEVIERVSGLPLDVFAQQELFAPLGMQHTRYCPPADWQALAAATEVRPGQTRATVGVVHDSNAASLDGVAGHAGLFSRIDDVARALAAWTDPSATFLAPWTRARALRPRAPTATAQQPNQAHRGLGWVLRGDVQAQDALFIGDLWPPSTAGHTGFTGTSVVFDPVSGLWAILLTNRVHLGREVDIGRLRRAFHNVVAAAAMPSDASPSARTS